MRIHNYIFKKSIGQKDGVFTAIYEDKPYTYEYDRPAEFKEIVTKYWGTGEGIILTSPKDFDELLKLDQKTFTVVRTSTVVDEIEVKAKTKEEAESKAANIVSAWKTIEAGNSYKSIEGRMRND